MTLAYNTAWSNLVLTSAYGVPSVLDRFHRMMEVPEASSAGAVSVTMLDNITVSTITDGTVQTNDMGQTQVSMTLVEKAATLSLPPTAARSSLTNPANQAVIAMGAANALVVQAQQAIIVAMVAATPGISNTLTTGQIDFTTDGTLAEQADNLRKLASTVVQCCTAHNEIPYSEHTILTTPAGMANLAAIQGNLFNAPLLNPSNSMWSFMGVPIFVIGGYTTNWGAASKDAAFVANNKNYCFCWAGVYLHGGGPIAASDGHTKWITIGKYCHGVILDDYIGTVVNPAS